MPTKTIAKKVTSTAKKGTSKKAAPKKVTKGKKATPKKAHIRALVCAIGEECFWTHDGKVLENLADLQMAFGTMDEEVFLHHANKEKNDFADWVEYVLQDLECAAMLREAKKKADAEKILAKQLRYYVL